MIGWSLSWSMRLQLELAEGRGPHTLHTGRRAYWQRPGRLVARGTVADVVESRDGRRSSSGLNLDK
jgi:hypothetical protein